MAARHVAQPRGEVGEPDTSKDARRPGTGTWQRRALAALSSRGRLGEDLATAYDKDPALTPATALQALLYQGLWAVWAHRLAHRWWQAGARFPARLVSQLARAVTGIEIHPGAQLGRRVFIDHGAGVVIGETAVIGDDVMLYHGVTLGGHGWWADAKGERRHPIIGDKVTIGVGASVLGAVHVGAGCRIGPHALVVDDVPPDSVVVAERGRCIITTGVRQSHPRRGELLSPEWLGATTRHAGGDDGHGDDHTH
ncbi:MAG: serine O-acetyltransferase [Actinomycetota bacterium]|nr:serine O-acetyltransferase [Actinomycetota bacterium]